ncbi:hypothetical protein BG004_003213 [Podila humilis]|nr:hypothetical protein BG004_003213 [Podila humilis]
MHDAAALANWICSLETPSVKELERIFEEYRKERLPRIKEAFIVSRMLRDVGGKTYYAAFIRALFKWMPRWAWRQVIIKGTAVRSQVSFLPLVEDVGEVSPIYQTSLHRTRERQQQNDYVVDMREYNVVREKWSRL